MTGTVPLFSASAANAGLDLLGPVRRVIDSHRYILGQEVEAFEREFAAYVGAAHCVSLANGTDALELGLRALGVGAGDLVAVPANAGFYGSTALRLIGAEPLYIDVSEDTMTMSSEALEQALAIALVRPRAIVGVHLYGQLADIEGLCRVADAQGIPVLEDCAQSHGARRNGRQCGTYGAIAAFSFYPTKNLGALGDGGAVVTSDSRLVENITRLRQYGWSTKYHVDTPRGRNSRLDEMQAALLREKLPHLDRWNAERRAVAVRYNAAFEGLGIVCPASLDEDYVAHLYVVRVPDREAFRAHLSAQGVATDIHYPIPDHRQAAYAVHDVSLPVTEAACASVVSLPCYPGIPGEDVERVVAAVRGFFARNGASPC